MLAWNLSSDSSPEQFVSIAKCLLRACTVVNTGETLRNNIDLIPELVEDTSSGEARY